MNDRHEGNAADAVAMVGEAGAAEPATTLADTSLSGLFARARAAIREQGERHDTPRGPTASLNGVALTWLAPERDTSQPPRWRPAEIDWYLDTFVRPRPENDPSRIAMPGALVFPYTYAARARFWDGGWGSLEAFADAVRAADLTLAGAAASRGAFEGFLAALGERMHLQTVLALCALYPLGELRRWLDEPERIVEVRRAWRRDLLSDAIADIAETPSSRRAVVASLSYPQLEDQLRPRMGLPPYQLFQFLPAAASDPLSSIHVHRSLDLESGAVLDFFHDLGWLREASERTGRPIGDITVVANNLHAYVGREEAGAPRESIRAWLCRVTDGYETGRDVPAELFTEPAYRANVERVWSRWRS